MRLFVYIVYIDIFAVQVVAPSSEEEAAETPAAQKREERLRKFRELHFKRVRTSHLSSYF